MQVCKYDAPIRRRRGRVTTERRKSVGAEREQKGEREGWRHGRWLGASPATQAYVVTDDTESRQPSTPQREEVEVKLLKFIQQRDGGGTAPR